MTLFPELDSMPFTQLQESFSSEAHTEANSADHDLWLQEVAVKLAKSGPDGLAFLTKCVPEADQARLRAILIAFSFIPPEIVNVRRGEIIETLVPFLHCANPTLIGEAVEALACLGITEQQHQIFPLLAHSSPFVVSAAIRYFSRRFPEIAKPILLRSLESKEALIRENAIDELDNLACTEALPQLLRLLSDDDEHVRQAAKTAVANLKHIREG
jgi:hypothetical protein